MQNNTEKRNSQQKKELLREKIRKLKLTHFEQNKELYFHLSRKMYEKVKNFKEYAHSPNLGIYASKKRSFEIHTDDIINHALSQGKYVYLPRCIINTKNLEFTQIYNLKNDTEIATFSIREPKIDLQKNDQSLFLKKINILFIPGMAFDTFGNRMGYGTGYFDNFIHSLRRVNKGTHIVGLAFDFQIFNEEIPHDSNDAKVDFILSPSVLIKIPKN